MYVLWGWGCKDDVFVIMKIIVKHFFMHVGQFFFSIQHYHFLIQLLDFFLYYSNVLLIRKMSVKT